MLSASLAISANGSRLWARPQAGPPRSPGEGDVELPRDEQVQDRVAEGTRKPLVDAGSAAVGERGAKQRQIT